MSRVVRVYRVQITAYPDGATKVDGSINYDWEPPGWEQLADKYNRFDPGDWESGPQLARFSWPLRCNYLSRSGAEKRAAMLRDFGATVRVDTSDPVCWPGEGS